MDFTRSVQGQEAVRDLAAAMWRAVPDRALTLRRPVVHHSGQEVQYAADGHVDMSVPAEFEPAFGPRMSTSETVR
jgi:hypothetical protein